MWVGCIRLVTDWRGNGRGGPDRRAGHVPVWRARLNARATRPTTKNKKRDEKKNGDTCAAHTDIVFPTTSPATIQHNNLFGRRNARACSSPTPVRPSRLVSPRQQRFMMFRYRFVYHRVVARTRSLCTVRSSPFPRCKRPLHFLRGFVVRRNRRFFCSSSRSCTCRERVPPPVETICAPIRTGSRTAVFHRECSMKLLCLLCPKANCYATYQIVLFLEDQIKKTPRRTIVLA